MHRVVSDADLYEEPRPTARSARWSWITGEKGRNRVRVFTHARSGLLYLEWYEPATGAPSRDHHRRTRSLGHSQREDAKSEAEHLSRVLFNERYGGGAVENGTTKRRRRRTGTPVKCVYLISNGYNQFKVGFTTNISQRLTNIRVGSPSCRLLCVVPGGLDLEHEIHEQLSQFSTHGEWFAECTGSLTILHSYFGDPSHWTVQHPSTPTPQ